jgi:hypothetical protein
MKSMFKSSMEQIKELTGFIQIDSDDEEEEEALETIKEEPVDGKASQSSLPAAEEAPKKEDPNKDKFVPGVIHLSRSEMAGSSKHLEAIMYQQGLKPEEQF